jgi:hypothetical protein
MYWGYRDKKRIAINTTKLCRNIVPVNPHSLVFMQKPGLMPSRHIVHSDING